MKDWIQDRYIKENIDFTKRPFKGITQFMFKQNEQFKDAEGLCEDVPENKPEISDIIENNEHNKPTPDLSKNTLPKYVFYGKEGDQTLGAVKEKEKIDHPQHYGGKDNLYEAIKVIEAWDMNFNLGNVLKYISRCGKKDNEVQELEKALWYLKREIENRKNG